MSYRKEKKFRLSNSDFLLLKSILISKGLKELFNKRKITSQYFDTNDFKMFADSEEGVLPRKKVRVRWYNNDLSDLQYEEKTSSIEGRFKLSNKIDKDTFNRMYTKGSLNALYGKIFPSIKISYFREYYTLNNLRITFDSNIIYTHNNHKAEYRDYENVVEIKTSIDTPDDFIESIVPVPVSRFSKYCRAFLIKDKVI